MAKNGLPGYPSAAQLQAEALALARSAVPTRRSITRQYGRQIQSTQGFTEALAHLLGQANPGAGYDTALSQQQGVDAAAQQRLAALGGQYGAGSAAAVGGIGDSALSSLIARGAAAKNYAAQLPQVAAARGQLYRSGLVKDENAALQQRAEDLRSSYAQAIQQVQQNALARSVAAANITNQRGQLALQSAALNERAGEFAQTQAERQREFAVEHNPAYLKFVAGLQNQTSGTGPNGQAPIWERYGLTANEWQGKQSDTYSNSVEAAKRNIPFQTVIQTAIARGIPPPIAILTASRVYAGYKGAPAGSSGAAAFQSYQRWVGSREWRRYLRFAKRHPKQASYAGAPPGQPTGSGHK